MFHTVTPLFVAIATAAAPPYRHRMCPRRTETMSRWRRQQETAAVSVVPVAL